MNKESPSSIQDNYVSAETAQVTKSSKKLLVGASSSSSQQKIVGLIMLSSLAALSFVVFFHQVFAQAVFDQQQYSDFPSNNLHETDHRQRNVAIQNGGVREKENRTRTRTESTKKEILSSRLDQRNTKSLVQAEKFASDYRDANKKDSTHHKKPSSPQNDTQGNGQRCFPYNSKYWLAAGQKRLGNANDSMIDDEFVRNTIVDTGSLLREEARSKSLLQQSLCHPKSRFLSFEMTNDEISKPTNETIHYWSLRLIYMAAHLHQHLPAKAEAQVRLRESCTAEMESMSIGTFDYECPDTKFLIVSLGQKGLGAVMRLGAVNALVAGISSNRTVVFVNNSPTGLQFLRDPWMHASCPRRDAQCFFMPITPCVLTNEDIKFAPLLERGEARLLFKKGEIPQKFQNQKAVIVNIVPRPQKTPTTFRSNVVHIINKFLINPLTIENPSDPRIDVLRMASKFIYEKEPGQTDSYYYFGHNVKHNGALVFYAMRPNHYYMGKLREITEETFPESFDPELAFGLPIRASDKCIAESECRSFDEYMRLMDHTWKMHKTEFLKSHSDQNKTKQNDLSTSIIVTSEAPNVHKAQVDFQRQGFHKNLSFPFEFVNNGFDLHQGSGNPSDLKSRQANMTSDDIMLSSISTLKVQLHARYTVGNCCSNFHLLLFDFLKGGCGASKNQKAECLQDSELPEFRLCCEWSKSEECLAKSNSTG
jgi:hypothetical protein